MLLNQHSDFAMASFQKFLPLEKLPKKIVTQVPF